jgi:hypothetical protein
VRSDVVAGVILLVVTAVFWLQRDYGSRTSGTFPDLVLIGLAVLGAAIIVKGVRSGDRSRRPRATDLRLLAAAGVLVLLWGVLMGLVGFTISGVVAFVAMALLIREGRPTPRGIAIDAAVGVVVVVACFLIFTKVLQVPLPVSTVIGM